MVCLHKEGLIELRILKNFIFSELSIYRNSTKSKLIGLVIHTNSIKSSLTEKIRISSMDFIKSDLRWFEK